MKKIKQDPFRSNKGTFNLFVLFIYRCVFSLIIVYTRRLEK